MQVKMAGLIQQCECAILNLPWITSRDSSANDGKWSTDSRRLFAALFTFSNARIVWLAQGKSAAILNSKWTPCLSVLMTSNGRHKLFPTTWLVLYEASISANISSWWPTPALLDRRYENGLRLFIWTQYSISKIKCIYSWRLYSPHARVRCPRLFN
jgi:hypothetical protein